MRTIQNRAFFEARFLWAFGLQSQAMKGNSQPPLRIPAPREPEPPDPVTPKPPAETSKKWLQQTLAVHIERDERLAAYWEEKLLSEAFRELRTHFPEATPDFEAALRELAPETAKYLSGKIKVPLYSYAWAQPLTPDTQKFDTGLRMADPIFAPARREEIVKNLLATCNEIGWKPLYDFEAGLQQTVDWYRRNVGWLKGVKRS